jgi:hypothetical protein
MAPPADRRGAEKPPADPRAPLTAEKKLLSAIPLKKLDAKSVAEKIAKLLPDSVTVVAARDENTLIVYAGAKGTDDVHLVLRALGEELPKEPARELAPDPKPPAGQKTFAVRFQGVPWDEVFDWYAKVSGLTLVTAEKPTGKLTFESPAGKQYTLAEITDILNEALTQQKFILVRRTTTFFLHPADERLDRTKLPRVELPDLSTRGRTEMVEVRIPLSALDAGEIRDDINRLLTPFGAVVLARGRELIVSDTAGNIDRIARTIDALEKANRKPVVPAGEPKRYPVNFNRATWEEVFRWYAKESGLGWATDVVPGGTFTLQPPYTRVVPADPIKQAPPEKQVARKDLTLDEITDRINEALLAQKWLLVPLPHPWERMFHVIRVDEKIDPKLVKTVSRKDLDTEGKYTLVEVTIDFTYPDAPPLDKVLKTKLSPFGRMVPGRGKTVTIRDIAGNLRQFGPSRGEGTPNP